MSRILIITPNPLLDCLHHDTMTAGAVTRSAGLDIVAGGKGINVGRVLRTHGHEVIATGFAGAWSGAVFRDIVAAEGQTDVFVQCAARLRLGFLAKDCAGAGATALLENGFAVTQDEIDELLAVIEDQLESCDLCIVSGSIPDPSCMHLFTEISKRCRQHKCPCWIDSYGPAMDAVLYSAYPPDLCKPNAEEYIESEGWIAATECHITDGSIEIRVLLHGEDEDFSAYPPKIECINPIGSGDSYIGALAHARLSGRSFPEQVAYAAAAGAVNASQMEVAAMSVEDIELLYAENA